MRELQAAEFAELRLLGVAVVGKVTAIIIQRVTRLCADEPVNKGILVAGYLVEFEQLGAALL